MTDYINKTTLKTIATYNDSIDDELFNQILQFSFDSLLNTYITDNVNNNIEQNKNNNNNNNTNDTSKEDDMYTKLILNHKNSNILDYYNNILILLTQCVKNDLSINEIQNILLNDSILSEDRITLFLTQYQKNIPTLRFELMKYRICCTTIIDFKWRLDYNVHSNVLEDIKEQTTVLTFIVIENGEKKDITFNCDLSQLNDLFGHVKDAMNKKKI